MSPNEDHVDSAIRQIEHLYAQVTGQNAPSPGDAPYAPIPAERDPLEYVEEQIALLTRSLGASGAMEPLPHPFVPAVSLWEDGEGYVVCVDLPGVPRENLSIAVAGSTIEITGERPAPRDTSGGRLLFTERVGGRFRRLVALPPAASTTELRAEVADGVLSIRVPRAAAPRTVAVS